MKYKKPRYARSLAKARSKQFEQYVDACAQVLLLKDWAIKFDEHGSLTDDEEAEIDVNDGQEATIKVANAFWLKLPEEQRLIVVHELCHLHLGRIMATQNYLSLGPSEAEMFRKVFAEALEHAVEMFARILAPLIPLPRFE